jgi:hypothetical protein
MNEWGEWSHWRVQFVFKDWATASPKTLDMDKEWDRRTRAYYGDRSASPPLPGLADGSIV